MKKWILILCLFLLIVIGFSVNVYFQAMKPIKKANEMAEKRAREEASLVSTEQFYLYNGTESYYVAVGKQENGQKVAVWVPEEENQKVTVIKWADGISKKEALNKLKENDQPSKILGVRIGIEKNVPIWEISYLDESSNLNYFYVDFLKSSQYYKEITDI